MVKRVFVNLQGEEALKGLVAKIKKHDPTLGQFQTALVSIALIDLNDGLTDAYLKALSERLLTRTGKKKKILERLEAISENLDEERFSSLENNLNRVCSQFEKNDISRAVENKKTPKFEP